MYKNTLLVIFLFLFMFTYAAERNTTNSFNIELTVKPTIEDSDLPRGTSIRWTNFIFSDLYWGTTLRIMVNSYTSLSGNLGWDVELNDSLSIPINLGLGLKVKNISLNTNNQEGLKSFISGTTGMQWRFDTNWYYILYAVYDYNLDKKINNSLLLSLGIKYLF